ncbi:S41 family peptidase [Caldicellulosiruptor morganii]|uniref:S41 family peptidase n=1 Tax=Caldicellulosiruptor morganii TaxID=1387555 RepID=A0ABY7BQI4_9FIRM|nr:S41 family peptidase [Caldicellulosiruptor morganii]WAM34172.1 S41 family peptidase [Caldicellulosiruptor morganii]
MNRNKKFKVIAIVIVLSLLISVPVYSQFFIISNDYPTDQQMEYIKKVLQVAKDYHIGKYSYDDLIDMMFAGLFKSLDKYSEYMKPQQAKDFTESVNGEFSGIGVQIEKQDDYIVITGVFDGTPAKEAGLKVGDKIIAADGKSLVGKTTDDAVKLIRGQEGTTVVIDILRDGKTYRFSIVRRKIKIPVVEYKVLENNIGYIKLTQFTQGCSDEVKKVLSEFDKKGIKNIIFDIRNNRGGLLDEVVKMCKFFVPEGPIVTIEYNTFKDEYKSDNKNPKYRLAVLTNESSASASEIFAQAIKDTKVGVVIGTKTYGKGTVQTMIYLPETDTKKGYMAKVTVAKYKSPSGYYVDGKGVIPDIEVQDDSLAQFGPDKILSLSATKKFKKGDMDLEVLAAQQRLYYLGYLKNWTGRMDDETVNAVKKFQKDNKLYPYGVLDITTQKKINERFAEFLKSKYVDKQLQRAVRYFKEGR